MIKSDPSSSIREFLLGQVVDEDIFLIEGVERVKFYHKPRRPRRKTAQQGFSTKKSDPSNRPCWLDQRVKGDNRSLALFPKDVSILMKTRYPIHIMGPKVVTSNGDVMRPSIFLHGFRHNWKACIKCQEEVKFSWFEMVTAGGPYV